jgi:hypothetical protein
MQDVMSIGLQTPQGLVWHTRDLTAARMAKIERDQPSTPDRTAGANPRGYGADASRLAALRRDAPVSETAEQQHAKSSADDAPIGQRTWTA